MLENPTSAPPPDSSPSSSTAVRRYAPPNQRNRSLNRRKSGERFDRTSNVYPSDGEKNQQHAVLRNIAALDHSDFRGSNFLNENSRQALIALEGCCRSEASQLLNDRWTSVMHSYNDTSLDLSERPVMYSGSSASAWGHFKLPHQLMPPANSVGPSTGSQMDFLSELDRAIHNANISSNN